MAWSDAARRAARDARQLKRAYRVKSPYEPVALERQRKARLKQSLDRSREAFSPERMRSLWHNYYGTVRSTHR